MIPPLFKVNTFSNKFILFIFKCGGKKSLDFTILMILLLAKRPESRDSFVNPPHTHQRTTWNRNLSIFLWRFIFESINSVQKCKDEEFFLKFFFKKKNTFCVLKVVHWRKGKKIWLSCQRDIDVMITMVTAQGALGELTWRGTNYRERKTGEGGRNFYEIV